MSNLNTEISNSPVLESSSTPIIRRSHSSSVVAKQRTKLATQDSAEPPLRAQDSAESTPTEVSEDVSRNMGVMNVHQILMRTGWIFKTESLVMPAVLDMVGGSAWLRGCLPMLNRFGQSLPPWLAAGTIGKRALKKRALFVTSMSMGILFLMLAGIWYLGAGSGSVWLPLALLVIYGLFFSAMGLNQLVASALTGKLIPIRKRGRLMQVSSFVGSIIACLCAWFLLREWLATGRENFTLIFGFAGILFLASGWVTLFFVERPDEPLCPIKNKPQRLLADSWYILRHDANFRLLAIVAALSGTMFTLFPHYQAVGRLRLGLGYDSLVPWIIAQNLGVALFSLPIGWIADRVGNRLVLMLVMLGLSIVPALSIGLTYWSSGGANWYWVVFALLGLTPVSMRLLSNYALELTSRQKQAHYLGVLSLAMAGPAIFASLLVGVMIDWVGFDWVFAVIAASQVLAFVLTIRLIEPRNGQIQ